MNKTIKQGLAALQLIRPLNLAFIALTQYLLLFHFLFPLFQSVGAPIGLPDWRAIFFILTTTLLTAAGYGINDYIDIETDKINKPNKWLVGNQISKKTATIWISVLLGIGAILAAWLALDIRKLVLWLIYPFTAFLLWAYSHFLKGIPLAGNLLVALLCMMVGGIVWFAERIGIDFLFVNHPQLAWEVVRALVFYLGFAFLATLYRELVKDCEDVKGDALTHQQTLPVRLGLKKTRNWALLVGSLLVLALLALAGYFYQKANTWSALYSLGLLLVPHLAGLVSLSQAREPSDFRKVSWTAKWLIFAGVFLILFLP